MAGKNFQLIYIHPFKRRHLPFPLCLPRTESYYCPCFPPPRRELISQQIYYYKFCRKLLYKVRRVKESEREIERWTESGDGGSEIESGTRKSAEKRRRERERERQRDRDSASEKVREGRIPTLSLFDKSSLCI